MAVARPELTVSEIEWVVGRLEAGPPPQGMQRRALRELRRSRDLVRAVTEREAEHMRQVKENLEASYQQRFGQQA